MLVNELSEYGFEVCECSDGEDAWRAFQTGPFDLVISDVEMPQMTVWRLRLRSGNQIGRIRR